MYVPSVCVMEFRNPIQVNLAMTSCGLESQRNHGAITFWMVQWTSQAVDPTRDLSPLRCLVICLDAVGVAIFQMAIANHLFMFVSTFALVVCLWRDETGSERGDFT